MFIIPDVYIGKFSTDVRELLYDSAVVNAGCIKSLVVSEEEEEADALIKVLETVASMQQLERLHVTSSQRHVEKMLSIICKKVRGIQHLKTFGFKVPEKTTYSLPVQLATTLFSVLRSLTSLDLRGLSIQPSLSPGLHGEVNCQLPNHLISLSLRNVSVLGEDVLVFPSSLRSLRSVDIINVTLPAKQIERLFKCLQSSTDLHTLKLIGLSCACGCKVFRCKFDLDLSSMSQLQHLGLSKLKVTEVNVCPRKLERVWLKHLSERGAVASVLTNLSLSQKLKQLTVTGCSLSYDDICALSTILPGLTKLEKLLLCSIECDDQVISVSNNMLQLREIGLYTVRMQASGWSTLIQTLPRPSHQLKVKLQNCNVDERAVAEIRSSSLFRVTYMSDTVAVGNDVSVVFHTMTQTQNV